MIMKSKIKWFALIGSVLSLASLATHLLLARYSTTDLVQDAPIGTVFSWKPILEHNDILYKVNKSSRYRALWGPVKKLEYLKPYANPRGRYPAASWHNNGYIYVKIQGGFHEIRSSICDVVAIARLLNATLVIPELQEAMSTKKISSKFKSFGYLYDENHFIETLANDVIVVKSLPKDLKSARKNHDLPVFTPARFAPADFYLKEVLPKLRKKEAIGLVISGGGCLQALLPARLEEFQRLRCRVAFHALNFRGEISELAARLITRLRSLGRPFLVFHSGLERDALAYHGCAELYQDVHTELIQYRRSWLIKHGIVRGNLSIESELQRRNGSCPLMPQEVAVLLKAMGYPPDTIIYISGGEIFGGQRVLIPLRAMFNNLVDRKSLCTEKELSSIYGPEEQLFSPPPPPPPLNSEKLRLEAWQKAGPRPRPLPPPAARPRFPHEVEGWWSWIAQSDKEPEPTALDLRKRAHRLLWESLDYIVSMEADAFFPGFDLDANGLPGFASLVMGHRLYASASLKTYRIDRRPIVKLLDNIRDNLYKSNSTWSVAVRQLLMASTRETGLANMSVRAKADSFLSYPFPECGCQIQKMPKHGETKRNVLRDSLGRFLYGGEVTCPEWMASAVSGRETDADYSEDIDIADIVNVNETEDSSNKSEEGQQNDQEEEMDGDE